MSYTRATYRAESRQWAVDTDAVRPGLTDPEWNIICNAVYTTLAPFLENSTQYEDTMTLTSPDYAPQLDLTGVGVVVREFRNIWIDMGAGIPSTIQLEIQPWPAVFHLSQVDTTLGRPRCCGPRLVLSESEDQQLWTLYLWPRPSASFDGTLHTIFVPEHIPLTADGTSLGLSSSDGMQLARVSGALGAMILDQPKGVIEAAMNGLPERLAQETARRWLDGRRPQRMEDIAVARGAAP